MSGVNPEGCEVFSFKEPSQQELDHDFLWRAYRELPRRGRIGIFNRSYYEDVLVTRVHPELLVKEQLPGFQAPSREQRFESILDFERHLHRNGTLILKFFLHLSREEQAKRLLERMDDPAKNWKFSPADLQERLRWNDYMQAYEDMINHTSTEHAPWFIVPADHKWFTHLTVSDIIVDRLQELNLQYPSVTAEQRTQLLKARRSLLHGKRR
jgi:PPK2 family polyphosphate:nucleotide phosphotransferase